MKNLLRFLLLSVLSCVCLPPPLIQAQLVGPKSITSTNCISIDSNGLVTVAIYVAGISGSLQPQGTIGGQAVFNMQVSPAGTISPASTISGEKQQRLDELLRKYRADQIAPEEYHAERAKILAEP